MNYTKPSISKLAEAVTAIQGSKSIALTDSPPDLPMQTVPAYEADE